jgi:hypothetical protein
MLDMRSDLSSAFAAAALLLVGFALSANTPPPAEPTAELARHLADGRTRILAGDLLVGAGAMFYIWFLAALRTRLAPERTLATTALIGGAMGMTIVLAGVALQSGLVLDESTLASTTAVRLGFDGYNALITIAGFGFALTVAATSGSAARTGTLGPALRTTGWLTAALQLATMPGLIATSGPFAPAAPVPVLAFWALCAWSTAVAVVLIRREAPAH